MYETNFSTLVIAETNVFLDRLLDFFIIRGFMGY